MADGLCSGDPVGDVIEKNKKTIAVVDGGACADANAVSSPFYLAASDNSDKLFEKMCADNDERGAATAAEEGFLHEDDCRKKRCVDRYDSSESSDSGVAVLSCTDCSGSSTASSDITDPGSPFSTASTHSEDSGSQPATRMPPTQSAHHPPWPWTAEEGPPLNKRSIQQIEKTALLPKRLKSNEDTASKQQSPPCLHNTTTTTTSPNNNKKTQQQTKKVELQPKQGKITEYFKSQIKLHMINNNNKNKEAVNKSSCNSNNKVSLVDQQTQFNGISRGVGVRSSTKKSSSETASNNNNVNSNSKSRNKVTHHVTVPRKILPAPSKISELNHHNHHHNQQQQQQQQHHNLANFASTVTLTAVTFPPNLAYLHTKTPKPPDNIFVPQINTIPCLNVIHHHQPVQKIATINCVKLNATVVPIVKLNTLPSRLNVETVLSVAVTPPPPLQPSVSSAETAATKEKAAASSGADSDSGVSSSRDALEVAVEAAESLPPPQKSPILSQPKTIRFPPAKQEVKEEAKDSKGLAAQESGCRWAECSAQFDTSGALLEHLQVKHVISQATQEQYVCLWLGCKVHGRTSCSRSWLERHVLAHAGTKPFRCIVDGCGQRFNSQLTLERHVNGHFNGDGSQTGSAKKSTENSSSKLFKRNGKRIRFRRQPWSARMFDFIDNGIMEGLQHKLLTMTQDRTLGQIHNPGDCVDLHSQVVARRVEPDGRVKFLVRWHPADIIPDEWMSEKEYVPSRSVPIPSLEPVSKAALQSRLFPAKKPSEKRRRKHPSSSSSTTSSSSSSKRQT